MDAIGAGQIDDVVFRGTVGEIPCFFLYRDAWIIACFLTQAGQLIEQSRLTHVGVPHQRDFSFRHNDDKGSMRMRSASVRRKATLLGLPLMCRQTGPLNGNRCFMVKMTPGKKPISYILIGISAGRYPTIVAVSPFCW